MESELKREYYFYFIFRVLVGLLFLQHGAQKILGLFGGTKVEFITLFWIAGVIELVGGLMIAMGFLTRTAAFFGVIDMIGALYIAHIPNGWIPIINGGELALLYLASFLVILVYGSRRWSLDSLIFRKKEW